ncbi:MAG: 30S ribosomal protein S19 [Thermoplasmata archaeon]|nr:30S ribosomal protein S19 [Thermoplasmata archaeon]
MAKARKAKKVEARRKREFSFRGLSLPQLQAMSLEEFAKVASSRARRSIRRGFNIETSIFFERMQSTPATKVVRTHVRDALVLPAHVGRHVAIHNGKEFKEIEVRPEMVGHYYGEFSLTRRFEKHSGPGVGATRSSKFMPLK